MSKRCKDPLDDPAVIVDLMKRKVEMERDLDHEAVRIYVYNRQWLSHNDSVNAVKARVRISTERLRDLCKKAGVWDDGN